ncbi:HD domain protein [Dissulfuribacter thermophilus]|uniref:HD domain protein n=1 Tax=Dissulfuribacter thermophilus TaxID=1156395 RepID=A0A1B9F933_9BACT|nr:HDOD domain-containing protein [Dissulfuribacter thermophilus]OCC16420.1 HD domain protein [Dissulfuribacter thermophilus]
MSIQSATNNNDETVNFLKKRKKVLSVAPVQSFPALPSTVRTVLVLCGSLSSDANEIQRAVKSDFGMTLNLLKAINSAFYSVDKVPVMSILHAIVLLGMDVVARIVLDMPRAKVNALKGSSKDIPNWLILCARQVFSAHLGEAFAKYTDHDPEEVFYCSLFKNLGEVILSYSMEDSYQEYLRLLEEKRSWYAASRAVFGITFDEFTFYLMKKWNLPRRLADILEVKKKARSVQILNRRNPIYLSVLVNELMDFASKKDLKALKYQEAKRVQLKKILNLSENHMGLILRKELDKINRSSPVYYEVLESIGLIQNLLV